MLKRREEIVKLLESDLEVVLLDGVNIILINREIAGSKFKRLKKELEVDIKSLNFKAINKGDIIYLESGYSVELGHNLKILDKRGSNIFCKLVKF